MLANLVSYLVWWGSDLDPTLLAGDPRRAPWSPVTFGLLEPHALVGAALADMFWSTAIVASLAFLLWFGGDLEQAWGSRRFGMFWVGTSAVSYLVVFTFTNHRLTGPTPLVANFFMAWLTLNAHYELRVMFLLTLRLGFFRWLTLGLVVLSTGLYARFLPGLSALAGPLLAWWWSSRMPTTPRARADLIEVDFEPPADFDDEEVDRILDKIARDGMSALTPEERDLLDSKSQRLRRS